MRLKPLLFIAAAAGAAAAITKRRGDVDQLVQAMPEPVQRAVDKITPGGGEVQPRERYEPPAEGLAQPPVEPGGPPSDDVPVKEAGRIVSEPGEQLNVPEHAPPEGAVMPDTSAGDPLVDSQTKAAAGDAGAIGGNVDEMAAEDASFPRDPEMRPVVEGAGDENEETFEAREGTERGNRETET